MKAVSIALKDLRIVLRDRGALVNAFVLPILFVLVFSLTALVGQGDEEAGLVLPVVNRAGEGGALTAEFLEALEREGGLRVELVDAAGAQTRLEDRDIDWLLEIPGDFEAMSLDRAVSLRLVTHPDADQTAAESVYLAVQGVARDLALQNQLLASFEQIGAMMGGADDEYQVFTADASTAQAREQFESSKNTPLVSIVERVPDTGVEAIPLTSTQTLVPGITILFVFLSAQTTALSIFFEKRVGTFRRLLAAPLPKASLLGGKVLGNMILTLTQIVIMFAVGVFILPLLGLEPLHLGNAIGGLVVVSLAVAICASGLGLFLASVARTQAQVGGLSAVVLWVMGVVGGAFIPTFLMSGFLATLSKAVPHSWALRAYNDLLVLGRGIGDILPEVGILLAFAALFYGVALWRFEFE